MIATDPGTITTIRGFGFFFRKPGSFQLALAMMNWELSPNILFTMHHIMNWELLSILNSGMNVGMNG